MGFDVIYKFPAVKHTEKRSGTCVRCGKKCARSKTFMRTVNPFNKNPDGSIKTPAEVQTDNREEAKGWAAQPLLCKGCGG